MIEKKHELAVKVTCDRCGSVGIARTTSGEPSAHQWFRESGWTQAGTLDLCPDCSESYQRWLSDLGDMAREEREHG